MSPSTRADFATIASWINPGARVLDLGCGNGSLLRYLREQRAISGYGVEIDDEKLIACVANGVNVVQRDLEGGLAEFDTGSFDYVILSLTLQAVRQTEAIVKEMLRVGKQGIVTFPNFGYWRSRAQVMLGRMPVSMELPYQWYDTPNVHLCTIHDFDAFCAIHRLQVLNRVVITRGEPVNVLPNLLGALAVYRLHSGA